MPAICVYQLYQVSTALPKGFDYIYIIQYEVATAIPSGYGYTKWLQQYQMAMLWLWLHVSSRRNTKVSNLGPFLGWRVMLFSKLQQILFIVHTVQHRLLYKGGSGFSHFTTVAFFKPSKNKLILYSSYVRICLAWWVSTF